MPMELSKMVKPVEPIDQASRADSKPMWGGRLIQSKVRPYVLEFAEKIFKN